MYISIPRGFSMDVIYKNNSFLYEDNLYIEKKQPGEIFENPNYWEAVDEYYLQEVLGNSK